MDENAPIKVYMVKKLIGVSPDDSVQDAGRIMVDFDIGSLVVFEEDNVVGFFTKSDVIRRVIVPGLPYDTPVRQIMTKNLVTVNVNDPLKDVLKKMAEHRIKHILVEDGGKIVGVFSLSDLLDATRRKLETAIARE